MPDGSYCHSNSIMQVSHLCPRQTRHRAVIQFQNPPPLFESVRAIDICSSIDDAYNSMSKIMKKVHFTSSGQCTRIANTNDFIKMEVCFWGSDSFKNATTHRCEVAVPMAWTPRHFISVLYSIILQQQVVLIEPSLSVRTTTSCDNLVCLNQIHCKYQGKNKISLNAIEDSFEY